ncbi:MAG TPA: hypothetical protein VFW98_08480 [Gemmatimonadaceae bacterium]|nr:hypothetical protein [Gemmatimonadaceae bacterium]
MDELTGLDAGHTENESGELPARIERAGGNAAEALGHLENGGGDAFTEALAPGFVLEGDAGGEVLARVKAPNLDGRRAVVGSGGGVPTVADSARGFGHARGGGVGVSWRRRLRLYGTRHKLWRGSVYRKVYNAESLMRGPMARSSMFHHVLHALRVPVPTPAPSIDIEPGPDVHRLQGDVRVAKEGDESIARIGPSNTGDLEHWHVTAFKESLAGPPGLDTSLVTVVANAGEG